MLPFISLLIVISTDELLIRLPANTHPGRNQVMVQVRIVLLPHGKCDGVVVGMN